MKNIKRHGLFLIVVVLIACAPSSFVRQAPGWKNIEIREGLSYDDAWAKIVDVITAKYDIEIIDKASGYIRTAWQLGIVKGTRADRYRGRITIKVIQKENILKVKTEAHWFSPQGGWIEGQDSSFTRDVYSALMGTVGRGVTE